MDNYNLQRTLSTLIQSGSRSNSAMNALLNDYIKYHVVLVVVGGFFALIVLLLSLFFWVQWKRAPKAALHKWTFEKKIYFFLGVVSTIISLLIALIVAINATTVLNPLPGFSSLVDSLGTPTPGSHMDKLYQAFATWLQSGSTHIPSLIQSKVNERFTFHTTRAIVGGMLLIIFVVLNTWIWKTVIKQPQVRKSKWRLKERALFVSGIATITFSFLLMLIIIANIQGALAPLTLTMMYG